MMNGSSESFDRPLQLEELLPAADRERIEASLSRLAGCRVRLRGTDEPSRPGWRRKLIHWDLEPLLALEVEGGEDEQLQGAAELLLLLIRSAARFQMATDLHMETVHSDYEALQEKHEALKESEQRFRNLAVQLEQKVAEQVETIQAAQIKLYQAEKMASVGQLAAGIAHEINTPLSYIQSNFDSARSYLEDLQVIVDLLHSGAEIGMIREQWERDGLDDVMADFPQLLEDSLGGVTRVAAIVADLKVFFNINRSEQTLDDLNSRLDTVIKMIRPQLGEEVTLLFKGNEIPQLYCSPGHIGQVFYNLILNGVQSIEGKGSVVVETSMADGGVWVSVSDTGAGIAQEDLSRIFDPFFTTKEVGQGTGLGLTVISDIIKAHGGRIEVESRPGHGSCFRVFLPVREEV